MLTTPRGRRRYGVVHPCRPWSVALAQRASESGVPADVLARLLDQSGTRSTQFHYDVRDSRALQATRTIKLHVGARINASGL